MSCKCDTNYPINARTTAVTENTLGIVLEFSGFDFSDFSNLQKFNFVICQCIPETTCPERIYLSDGTNYIPLLVVSGNYVYSDQLKTRTMYYTVFGNNPTHFSLRCKVPNTSYVVSSAVSVSEDVVATPVATVKATKTA